MATAQIPSPFGSVCLPLVASGSVLWFLWPVAVSGLHLSWCVITTNLQEAMTKKSKRAAVVHSDHMILKRINRSMLGWSFFQCLISSMAESFSLSQIYLLHFQKAVGKNSKEERHKKWGPLKWEVVVAVGHGMQIETNSELSYSSQSSISAMHYGFLVNQWSTVGEFLYLEEFWGENCMTQGSFMITCGAYLWTSARRKQINEIAISFY